MSVTNNCTGTLTFGGNFTINGGGTLAVAAGGANNTLRAG